MTQEVEWEIKEFMDWELVQEEPTTLSEQQNFRLSPQEEFVKKVLEDYEFVEETVDPDTGLAQHKIHRADAESMLKSLFDDANKVISQNSKWDIIPDYAARAKLKLELLKSMGVIKDKVVEVKVNFLNLLFWGK